MQDTINSILALEAGFISELLLLRIIVVAWERVDRKLNQRYPFCDIDPMCHQAFSWAADGSGWIGSVCVIKQEKKLP